ncbi:MAG: cation-efflux pump [Anaerolineae bacterium]
MKDIAGQADLTPNTGAARAAQVQRVLLITLGLNLAAAGVKLAAGQASGSLALTAGGVDSLFDGGANVLALVGARAAAQPPDESHPYGHRKLETLVAVVIVALMFVTCARLATNAISRLMSGAAGEAPEIGVLALAAPLAAFGLNYAAATYEARWGRLLSSELLLADAGHTRADAAVSLALVGGLLAVRAGYPLVDPLLALGIAAVIAWVGYKIARDTAGVLSDAAALDPTVVESIARSVPGVEGVHKIRSRGPADSVAVDLHVQVEPDLGLERGHEIGHAVKAQLLAQLPGVRDVVVHIEPEWGLVGDDVATAVRRVAGRYGVGAHEIHVHTGGGAGNDTEVGLHLELDSALTVAGADEQASAIEDAIRLEAPGVSRVVTHLEPSTSRTLRSSPAPEASHVAALAKRETEQVTGLFDAHDIEVVRVPSGLRLSMFVRTIGELPLPEAHALVEELEGRLRAAEPRLKRVTIRFLPEQPDPVANDDQSGPETT